MDGTPTLKEHGRLRHVWISPRRERPGLAYLLKTVLATVCVWSVGLGAAAILPGVSAPVALAQSLRPELRDPFLADPLQDRPRDPLIPTAVVDRPLSPLELRALEQALDELAMEAEALAAAGETEAALERWMREVRLRRVLGLDPELAAIDRVAQGLRDINATQEIQLLTARLAVIQTELDIGQVPDRDRLAALAEIYTTLGQVMAAADLRQALATAALERGDRAEHQTQLEALALIYDDWFYFPEAAATYGELVALAQAQGDTEAEIAFLQRQIYTLDQGQDWAGAIMAQQQLLRLYSADEDRWPLVAAVQTQMAHHQRLGGDLEGASQQYQTAYSNAIASQQFEVAAESLRGLASLFQDLGRLPDVDYLYQQLILVERQAMNAYGLMDTFDQLGQLYELTNNPQRALLAYEEGLILAGQLRHRQDYFVAQIQRLTTAEPRSHRFEPPSVDGV